WMIVGTTKQWTKETLTGQTLRSVFFTYQRRVDKIDLPALYQAVGKTRLPQPSPRGDAITVVCFADMQLGKVGSRGGTPELLKRLASKRQNLAEYLDEHGSSSTIFIDVGDATEGFENTAQQQYTNDLSLPQ